MKFEYDAVGVGEGVDFAALYVLISPTGCGAGKKVPIKVTPYGGAEVNVDYRPLRDTLYFEADDYRKSIGFEPIDDDIPEGEEGVYVFFGDLPTRCVGGGAGHDEDSYP